MFYRRLFKLKEDTQSITDLEAVHHYLRSLEGIPTLHAQVLQRVFAKFGDSYILLDVYNISKKLELVHAHYEISTMKPPSRSRLQPPLVAPPDNHILLQRLKWCTWLHSSYLLANTMAILPTKLVRGTFLSRIFSVIIVGKRDIRKLFVLPSFQNRSNSNYHGKIYQHLLLPLNRKLRHINLPIKFSPLRVIPVRMFRRWSKMLTRGRCFKSMSLKFKFCKMDSNP